MFFTNVYFICVIIPTSKDVIDLKKKLWWIFHYNDEIQNRNKRTVFCGSLFYTIDGSHIEQNAMKTKDEFEAEVKCKTRSTYLHWALLFVDILTHEPVSVQEMPVIQAYTNNRLNH